MASHTEYDDSESASTPQRLLYLPVQKVETQQVTKQIISQILTSLRFKKIRANITRLNLKLQPRSRT